ncbi:MAG TPA: metal-sensitive transcriptional regulator [Candidatus Peribacteria bacterium]|nr:metal-sensitive transcriptional regulator [Candidatus Peribacteria bacterium]
MLPERKTKALAALKRLAGLHKKVESMIGADAYCVDILEQLLAMQGHMKYIQGQVLESHLRTCAGKRMASKRDSQVFVEELTHAIGLSQRS